MVVGGVSAAWSCVPGNYRIVKHTNQANNKRTHSKGIAKDKKSVEEDASKRTTPHRTARKPHCLQSELHMIGLGSLKIIDIKWKLGMVS